MIDGLKTLFMKKALFKISSAISNDFRLQSSIVSQKLISEITVRTKQKTDYQFFIMVNRVFLLTVKREIDVA
jgi:hypothetical protein